MLGQIFSLLFFVFSLTCYRVFFFFSLSGILLITLLCYVLYVNFVIVCYLGLFLPVYVSISVTALVEVGFSVFGGPDFGIGLCPFNEHQTKVACDLMAYSCQRSCGSQLLI